jgi:YjbE family integral membrane protein
MDTAILKAIGTVAAIILVDLALSGDNALVIGSVASKLVGRQRRNAITVGGLIAIVLRIALTFLAVFLLQIPFISIIGGIAVFVIAVQLIRDIDNVQQEEADMDHPAQGRRVIPGNASFVTAITTIAIADFSMSLDNALAIAALARTNYLLLIIGLLFSVTVLLVASAVVARLIARFPLLMYASGLILAITAGTMVLDDKRLKPIVEQWDKQLPGPPVYYLLLGAVVVLFGIVASIFHNHNATASKAAQS